MISALDDLLQLACQFRRFMFSEVLGFVAAAIKLPLVYMVLKLLFFLGNDRILIPTLKPA